MSNQATKSVDELRYQMFQEKMCIEDLTKMLNVHVKANRFATAMVLVEDIKKSLVSLHELLKGGETNECNSTSVEVDDGKTTLASP